MEAEKQGRWEETCIESCSAARRRRSGRSAGAKRHVGGVLMPAGALATVTATLLPPKLMPACCVSIGYAQRRDIRDGNIPADRLKIWQDRRK